MTRLERMQKTGAEREQLIARLAKLSRYSRKRHKLQWRAQLKTLEVLRGRA